MPSREFIAELVRVIDGDTVVVRVDLGFHVSYDVDVRMLGINAPEHNTPEGVRAKEFLTNILGPPGSRVRALVDKSEKYGRWLATLYVVLSAPAGKPSRALAWDDTSVNKRMVDAGLAKPWDGKGIRPT